VRLPACAPPWAPPRHVRVRYNFDADPDAQTQQLATVNAILQRKGSGARHKDLGLSKQASVSEAVGF